MNDPTPAPRTRIFPFLLAATAAFVLLFRLGARDFENKDTLWYVEIAWEMLRSGDWVVPRFNGVIFTEKPILFIWLVAGAAKLFGGLTPFVARLPSALAATGCVALTASLGRRLFGARAGILAGFVLCTGYAFAWEARTCMVDMTFSFFTTLTLFFLYLGEREDGRRAGPFLLAYAAAGLAALTKGPLGLGFPAIVFLAYLAWARRLRLVRRMRLPWGVVIVAALQAAWYLPYLVRIGPDGRAFFWEMYVVKENLLRLTTGFDKPEPFWFYLPKIAGHFLPWSVFLLLVPWAPPPARDRRFPAAWFLAVFAFLTLSSGKHSRYALPLYPAAALLVGDYWDRLIAAPAPRLRRIIPAAICVLSCATAVGIPVAAFFLFPRFPWRSLAAAAAPAAAAVALWRLDASRRMPAAFAAIVVAFAAGWALFVASLPLRDARRADHRRLAESVAPAVGEARLATYGLFSRRLALGFFTGRVVEYLGATEHGDAERLSAYLSSPEPVFCLLDTGEYAARGGTLPPHSMAPEKYRYKKFDLVLISNR